MTTSSSTNFELDVAEYIEEAFERCGLQARTGYDLQTARRSMNIMLAEWANRGLNQWTIEQRTQALTSGTTEYSLNTDIIDVLSVVVRRSGTDFMLTKMSRGEYLNIPTKTQEGRPTQYYFDRKTTPSITLWPTPENSTDTLVFYYVRRIQDVDTQVNTTDAPFRFLPCVIAGLSYYLAVKKAPDRIQLLKSIYEEEFQRASDEDDDRVPLKLTPDIKYLRV